MSGGDWISHYGDQPGTVAYGSRSLKADDYTFWWRGNAFATKVSYPIDGAAPVEMSFADKRGEYMISPRSPTTASWHGSKSARSRCKEGATPSPLRSTATCQPWRDRLLLLFAHSR